MKITKKLIKEMVKEELDAAIEEGGAMGRSPAGRTIDPSAFTPDQIANMIELIATIKDAIAKSEAAI
tara:strand:- start:40 stop:240 length:201 start_codon:yes stop_codon:yes gene_type:complete